MCRNRDALAVWVLLTLSLSVVSCQNPSSVKAMKRQMYKQMAFSRGCYKLLNTTGAIGCEEPTGTVVDAPVLAYKHLKRPLTAHRVLLVPEEHLAALLDAYVDGKDLQAHLKGVLVDPTGAPSHFSPAPAFPNAQWAPYSDRTYSWNPAGSGLTRRYYPFPMYILTEALAPDARTRAGYNHRNKFQGSNHVARMSLQMQGRNSSTQCLATSTCNPLGGYSVMAAMPPLPAASSGSPQPAQLPVTLVTAQVDSDGLFHDIVQGAEAPMSGLVALLAAMDVLSSLNATSKYQRRLLFSALVGEPWDLMGSRRLLWELHSGGHSTEGLDGQSIEQVVEVGHVGRATKGVTGGYKFYAHGQRGPEYGDTVELVKQLKDAAAEVTAAEASVSSPSPTTPGIPPSSLMAILRANTSRPGVVLTDYDTAFSTPFYHSHRDNLTTIDQRSVVAAALLLARTLHGIGLGDQAEASRTFKANVSATAIVVDQLATCLLTRQPGMACPLVRALMVPGYRVEGQEVVYGVQRYVGVLPFVDTSDPYNPAYKPDVSRFLWNYMAWKAAEGGLGGACDPVKHTCPAGQVCVGWKQGTKAAGAGNCMRSSTRYVPAYSPRVECQYCNDTRFRFIVTNRSVEWQKSLGWPEDPVWAESMWPEGVPDLQLLLKEDPQLEAHVLTAGVLLTAAALVISYAARVAAARHLKDV